MQARDLSDLVEGKNEWCNIPDIIRNTFHSFNNFIEQQGKYGVVAFVIYPSTKISSNIQYNK